MSRAALALLLGLAGLITSGCVYRMNVQQGNFLDPKQVEQLQVGMTRAQVRFVLGTPMLPDAFDRDRWDYVYYLKIGRLQKPVERRLSVYFEGDKVARYDKIGFDGGVQAAAPAPPPDPAAEAAPAPAAEATAGPAPSPQG
jgi:outer membrane protein assembly factor BamE